MKSCVLRWLVAPMSVVVMWAAVLLSVAPGASSGEQAPPIAHRVDIRSSEFAIGTYQPPAATATDDRAVHEDNHPPTF